ncbi:MAG: polymer-forming cytoskeletal protein [Burkholderiales bacterium]|nr:MAG: polymer-forming cytoskeletal protein [Burkholderiales bacterium]
MFGKKDGKTPTIDCLIGTETLIEGEVRFKGGLRIDGHVRGAVIAAEEGVNSLVLVSENARVEGRLQAKHVVVNGTVEGPVCAETLLELQPSARVVGEIRYRALEMHPGAVVEGTLSHLDDMQGLTLAASNEQGGPQL